MMAWILAVLALLNGTAAIVMALLPPFPVSWLYHHARLRKPIGWLLLTVAVVVVGRERLLSGSWPVGALAALALVALGLVLTYRMHQETAFPAVDYPPMAKDPRSLPLRDDHLLAVIDAGGVTRAYPLDYVIHHHVVNDRFGDRLVSLTYCAMCRSIIPFDVTELGPLFVGSFKHANMIVADRRTRTFFQQATFDSLLGPLHPRTLTMIPFQLLGWAEVKRLLPSVEVAHVTAEDLREFQLPIPGIWRRIVASEATPGLPASQRDRSFPARTHVIGVTDPIARPEVVFLKDEVVRRGVVHDDELDVFLVAVDGAVNGFRGRVADDGGGGPAAGPGRAVQLELTSDHAVVDLPTGTRWDLLGRRLGGPLHADLVPVALSDEYWFSWRRFHPAARLRRL